MPPKRSLPSALAASNKQKKFKPPFLIPPAPPPVYASSASESQPTPSQQGDDDITTLGQILESMMKVSQDRHARRRKDIEDAYHNELAEVERKAQRWLKKLRVRENRRQLAVLTGLKTLLARKKAIEDDILAAVEAMEEACETFGEMLKSDITAESVMKEDGI